MNKQKGVTRYQSPLYTPVGFYMLRAPALSADVFSYITSLGEESIGNESEDLDATLIRMKRQSYTRLDNLASQSLVELPLMIASPDLFEGLIRMQRGDLSAHRVERMYAGLMRYLVRMSIRPTPFGLFSGVAVGSLGESTNVQLGTPAIQHIRTRPDMSWLFSIIQQIEEDKDLIPQLCVMTNRSAYIAGARAIIPYADVYGKDDNRSIALRATPIVRFVLEQAYQPIPYSDLRKKLFEAFSHATEQQVDNLLSQLWEHHFLLSDLRPPLVSDNPTKYVLERLMQVPGASSVVTGLTEVLTATAEIDKVGVASSTRLIRDLVKRQEELLPGDEHKNQYYQIDATLSVETPQMNSTIGEAVAEATETLLRIGRFPEGSPNLHMYYFAFVERYGTETEVPLLDLLSPEFGLDAPPNYTQPTRAYPLNPLPHPSMQKYDHILCSLLVEALNNHTQEIELTREVLQNLTQWVPKEDNPPPPTMEMYLQIHATSSEAIDRGEWRGVVAPACLSYGGRTFCRFFDILGPEQLVMLQEYAKREEELFPDAIFAELSYLPTFGRGANVAIRPTLHSYEIVVNTTPSVSADKVIPLHDLVVGVRGKHFYVRSLRLGKRVIVTQSHMLNMMRAPNVCRFLLDVAQHNRPSLSSFDWGSLSRSPFLPRIVQKQIVLSPAQWNLQQSMIESDGFGSGEASWYTSLQRWRECWRVPRYVYLTQFDNRLLLDLEHPLSVNELRAAFKKDEKDKYLQLQEMLPDFDHLWLRDRNNRPYCAEIVVPLILKEASPLSPRKPAETQTELDTKPSYPRRVITNAERRKHPGDEWTYLKLYAIYSQHDDIITTLLREFVCKMSEQKLVDCWFYIRYADPEPHLRVRFRASDPQFKEVLLLHTLKWGRELVENGLIRRACLDTYDREIERYGGPEAMDALEIFFMANSNAVSAVVAAQYRKEITLDPLTVAVFSLDQFLIAWGFDFTERLLYMQHLAGKYDESRAFHPLRRFFCELLSPWDSNYDPAMKRQREKLRVLLSTQDQVLKAVTDSIRGLATRGELWQTEGYIVSSLMHMYINRLLGPSREQEQKIYALLRHTLESLQLRPAQSQT